MFDIPYAFEAREFLRKKLIGQKVNVSVDYIKPANEGYPEKICATIMCVSLSLSLFSKPSLRTLFPSHVHPPPP